MAMLVWHNDKTIVEHVLSKYYKIYLDYNLYFLFFSKNRTWLGDKKFALVDKKFECKR